jgi:hypothetical protein
MAFLLLALFALQGIVILHMRRIIDDQQLEIERVRSMQSDADMRAHKYIQMYKASEDAAEQCERISGLKANQ